MTLGVLDPLLLRNFAIALFIGALVGVEREHRAAENPRFGGLRTFMLIALVGGAAAWLGRELGMPWLVMVGLGAITVLLAVSQWTLSSQGLTGEVAALVVYLLGAASVAGHPEVAVVLGITTTALLAFRGPLHELAGKIAPDDLAAGLKLLFATFIVLPLLPDHAVDPLGTIVPYRLWWLVVLISGLSLLGYAAVRWLGPTRGLALTGVFGGLVSSTAVTLSCGRQSHHPGASADMLAMSTILAWAVMCVRVLVEVAVVNAALLPAVGPPLAGMAVAALGAAGWFASRRHAPPTGEGPLGVELRNPFSLWEATKFALLFAAILVVVELGRRYLDPRALYAVAALAGTTDVDAITLSMAQASVSAATASTAIVVAASANTVVKCGMAAATGTRGFGVRIGATTAAVLAAGALGLVLA